MVGSGKRGQKPRGHHEHHDWSNHQAWCGGQEAWSAGSYGDDSRMWCSQTSLVVPWIRICLPVQGTRVWSRVPEDATCCGATKPMHQNFWAQMCNYWSLPAQSLCCTTGEATGTAQRETCALQWTAGPAHHCWRKPSSSNSQCNQK